MTAGGDDVTSAFAPRPNGRFEGLITDLPIRATTVTAHIPDVGEPHITITNHPNGGPVFSGPQVQPWLCRNESATDDQCNQPATYEFRYKSSPTGQLQDYDPDSPPSDVATTTTDEGVTVPFIIRIEGIVGTNARFT